MTVSAIVTSHNNKGGLERTLLMLEDQTKKPDEVIVLVSGYEKPHSGWIIRDDMNDAGHDKRAEGLKRATKDLLFFVNDDDFYNPTFIEKMSNSIGSHDLIYCNFVSHLFGNMPVNSEPKEGRITSGNFMVKRELAQKVGYNHRHYQADGQFIEDLIKNNATHTKIHEVLYIHL